MTGTSPAAPGLTAGWMEMLQRSNVSIRDEDEAAVAEVLRSYVEGLDGLAQRLARRNERQPSGGAT